MEFGWMNCRIENSRELTHGFTTQMVGDKSANRLFDYSIDLFQHELAESIILLQTGKLLPSPRSPMNWSKWSKWSKPAFLEDLGWHTKGSLVVLDGFWKRFLGVSTARFLWISSCLKTRRRRFQRHSIIHYGDLHRVPDETTKSWENMRWSRSMCWGLVSDQPHLPRCVFHCFSMPWPDLELDASAKLTNADLVYPPVENQT